MIPVTKPYQPSKEKYKKYIDQIYESGWFTNSGPLLQELEERLSHHLGVKHVICVANGSLALQVAYKALNITGEVITTPFSFAATSSTLLWEGLTPIFCDIDKKTLNIDAQLIEEKITEKTSAILPVHVFGNPCEVEKIQEIAKKHNINVIYDAAHAFGVQYNGESVLKYGDVSTLSFHSTKLFHTIEGGAIITESDEVADKVRHLINFGIIGSESVESIGTNAKMNEFEAAMGLCVLDDIRDIVKKRRDIISLYKDKLEDKVSYQCVNQYSSELASYMPIIFSDKNELLDVKSSLECEKIYPRRYFYPSLDVLYKSDVFCENSRLVSENILCLPLSYDMSDKDVEFIVKHVRGEK